MKAKINFNNIFAYLLGNYRYYFYYGGWWSQKFALVAWLRKGVLRKHIKEQIAWRIEVMDRDCYDRGSCKLCGCETTALQMANKACDKPCYPIMMNKEQWEHHKKYLEDKKESKRIENLNQY